MGDMMNWVDVSLLYEEVETEEELEKWIEKATGYGMARDLQLQFIRENLGKIMSNVYETVKKIPERDNYQIIIGNSNDMKEGIDYHTGNLTVDPEFTYTKNRITPDEKIQKNIEYGPLMKADDPSKPWYPSRPVMGGVAGKSNIANSTNKNIQKAGQVTWNPSSPRPGPGQATKHCLAQYYSKDPINKAVAYFFTGMREGKRVWSKNWKDSMTFNSKQDAEQYAFINFSLELASKIKVCLYQ